MLALPRPPAIIFTAITILTMSTLTYGRPIGAAVPGPEPRKTVAIHYQKGKYHLDLNDKHQIRGLLKGVDLGQGGRILVVGHTDSTGSLAFNYKLSKKRADAVKKEIMSSFGIPARRILVAAHGPEDPVGNNQTATGRARNRRTEITLVGVAPGELQQKYHSNDPKIAQIDDLLTRARQLTKLGRYAEALTLIREAEKLGADRYSDWHAIYGIIGFYGGRPLRSLIPHFKMALALDPHNFDARDFLGRVEARIAYREERVLPHMGKSLNDPIPVTTITQEYEYMQLFEVTPIHQTTLDNHPVDVWLCRVDRDRTVTYYFDYSPIYDWAYK
jgi:hypothetical protein